MRTNTEAIVDTIDIISHCETGFDTNEEHEIITENPNKITIKGNEIIICDRKNSLLERIIKRMIDIMAGLVGTIILIPLTIVIWIINKIYKEDDGPLFFVQDRIGKNGEIFKMIKFRTMCVDADEKLEKFLDENPDVKEEFYVYRKIKNDPRVTKIGSILRKTSLDEWPQFLSVLSGKMSLVRKQTILN